MPLARRPAIAALTELRPGRYPDRTPNEMQELAVRELLREWKLAPDRVDGLLVCPAGMAAGRGADIFAHESLGDALGLKSRFAETVNAGGASYGVMLTRAAMAIEAGAANAVLCVGAGKFPEVRGEGADEMARMIAHPEFEYPYGAFIPALYALIATRHMHERGTTREGLAAVAVSSRAWALQHPDALMRSKGPISVDDVVRSRPITTPFNLLDCSVPCEGGAALLVASADVARTITDRPAYLLGWGEHHAFGRISQARDLASLDVAVSIERAFASAGLEPSDVDVASLYDAFTINPLLVLEEAGFVPRGHGGAFFAEGRGAPGGDLPVNTNGGLLSFGHTGDASGMSVLVEAATQVMGRGGERQVRDAEIAMAFVYGGIMAEHCCVLLGANP